MATPPVLSKVHTFAQDLERVRVTRVKTTPPSVSTPKDDQSPIVTPPVIAPIKATPAPATTTLKKVPDAPVKLTATSTRDASYPATIITDTKHNRFNLTAELSSAISDWWNEKVTAVKKSKKPTYSIPAVERRKGVVEAATTQTGRAATVDHREVVAKIKNDTVVPPPQAIAPAIPTPLPAAEPITEIPAWETKSIALDEVVPLTTIEAPLEEPQTSVVAPTPGVVVTEVVERSSRIVPTIPTLPKTPKIFSEIDSEDTNEEIEEVLEEVLPPVVVPTIPTPPPIAVSPIAFPKIQPVIPSVPLAPQAPNPISTTAPIRRDNAFSMLSEVPTPTLPVAPSYVKETIANRKESLANRPAPTPSRFASLSALAPYGVAMVFVLITIGVISYFMMSGTSNPPSIAENTDLDAIPIGGGTGGAGTDLGEISESVSAALDAPNKSSLYATIKNTAGIGGGLRLVTPLAYDTNLPLGTREILSLINRQFAPDFLGNINNVQVGMYREEPALLISINDEKSAQGGMFKWEATMSQDLSPWFGIPLRSISTTSITGFKDASSANRDVRVLTDDIGTERITYGFLNPYLLLVTTDTTSFLNISESYTGN